jgi:hypothetical protein
MSSSFKTLPLFASGPHRFAVLRQGHLVTPDFFNGGFGGGSTLQGLVDLSVTVTGRLIATSEPGLRSLREAIAAQLQEVPTAGALVDLHGRVFADMKLAGYVEDPVVDRGRERSVRYVATFVR